MHTRLVLMLLMLMHVHRRLVLILLMHMHTLLVLFDRRVVVTGWLC